MQSKTKSRLLATICGLTLSLQAVQPAVFAQEEGLNKELSIVDAFELSKEENTELFESQILELIQPAAPRANLFVAEKPAAGTTQNIPFIKGTGESNSFRIPSLITLSDGTLLAAADARWNTTFDGGGLDTIVSRSEDGGQTWHYSYANHLGDNGNIYNGKDSSCFIDPILVEKDGTVFLLTDLYPYGVALNGDKEVAPSKETGFLENGKLALKKDGENKYDYYLDGDSIYHKGSNEKVDGYTVDGHFNIRSTDPTNNNLESNLFFKGSPYQVMRTSYLYLTKSTDGGKNWSAPTLLNLKNTNEWAYLVAPGRGLVTAGGRIILPCYSYSGGNQSQAMDFVYSDNNGETWHRSAHGPKYQENQPRSLWSSESVAVELEDGTLRFFFRNDSRTLHYVDYVNDRWGKPVNTKIKTNSNCQISAIKYSRKLNGKQVIFVSNPTGPNGAGHNSSNATFRVNGKIFVGFVDENNQMDWQENFHMPVTENDSQFMYSCLTEQHNGSLSILYENKQAGWGTGDDKYYTMDFKTYDLAQMQFDKLEQSNFKIAAISDKTYGDKEFTLSTTGGNGNGAVTFQSQNPDILSIEGNTATIKTAGTVVIEAIKAEDNKYQSANAKLEITIAKKALQVKAEDKLNVIQGDGLPVLTYTVSGLVHQDTFTNPILRTTAKDTANIGTYAITIEGGELTNANSYAVTYEEGTLKIVAKPVPVPPVAPYIPAPASPAQPQKTPKIVLPKKATTVVIENEEIPLGPVTGVVAPLKNPKKTSEIALPVKDNQFRLPFDKQALERLTLSQVQELLVSSDMLTLGLDVNLLKQLPNNAIFNVQKINNVDLNKSVQDFVKSNSVFTVKAETEKKEAISLGEHAKVWVSIPFELGETSSDNVFAYSIDKNGAITRIAKSLYDVRTKSVVFEVNPEHSFTIGNEMMSFNPAEDTPKWAKDNVLFMAKRGILTPQMQNNFMPNEAATRQDLVALLAQLEQINLQGFTGSSFQDVSGDNLALPAIEWANRNNIVMGISSTLFAPEQTITREQIAVILHNYAKSLNIPFVVDSVSAYEDDASISDWAKESVMAMKQARILAGKGNNRFDPKGLTTNAELMTILRRFVELTLRKY